MCQVPHLHFTQDVARELPKKIYQQTRSLLLTRTISRQNSSFKLQASNFKHCHPSEQQTLHNLKYKQTSTWIINPPTPPLLQWPRTITIASFARLHLNRRSLRSCLTEWMWCFLFRFSCYPKATLPMSPMHQRWSFLSDQDQTSHVLNQMVQQLKSLSIVSLLFLLAARNAKRWSNYCRIQASFLHKFVQDH